MIIGYAFVVADLLHIGHLNFFKKCKEYCDFLIVGVYKDELAASYKRKPIIPFVERIELVAALKQVSMVIPVYSKDCTPALKLLTEKMGLKISFVFHGGAWTFTEGGLEYMDRIGARVRILPYYKGRSTTDIIAKIRG